MSGAGCLQLSGEGRWQKLEVRGDCLDRLQVLPEQTSSSSTPSGELPGPRFPGRAFGTGSLKAALTVPDVGGQGRESFRLWCPQIHARSFLHLCTSPSSSPGPSPDSGGVQGPPCALVRSASEMLRAAPPPTCPLWPWHVSPAPAQPNFSLVASQPHFPII